MRRLFKLTAALFGLAVVLLSALNYHVYSDLRHAAIADKLVELERQAEIRSQEIERSLSTVTYGLRQIALQYQLRGADGRHMHDELRQMETEQPYVRALSVADAKGNLLHSSRSHPAPVLNIADRDNIAYHIRGGPQTLYFSGPDRNMTDGRWQIALSMAIRDDDGRLKAVISSVIDPYAYAESFQNSVGPGDYVTLLDGNLRMIARTPWLDSEIGRVQAGVEAYKAFLTMRQPSMSGVFTNPFTGEERIVAVRRLFNDRLILSSSRSLAQAMASWQSLATIVSAISVLLLLLMAAAAVVALRVLADRENRARVLADLNHDLQDQTARAERLATVKGEFLATMSHEIRTPMNGVLGMAQALENLPLDVTARDYVTVIRESAESLLGIINDILDYSRLEAGKLKVAPSAIRLPVLMDTMSSLFSSACIQKKLAFRTEIDPTAPANIESDPMRLRQILVNLVGNAVKFTAAGGVVLRAKPAMLPGDIAGIRFEIEDTGPGISPAVQATIFERFAQADASISRRFGGTGLGLAICRRLSHLLGGRIGCQSEPGRGSLFWFEIPVELAEDGERKDPSLGKPTMPLAAGPPRVLCVDDNHVNRRIVATLLAPFCQTIVQVESGFEAIREAERQVFDIVLLDIHMPEMDGIETHHRLRSLAQGHRQRIIAVTADVVPEALARYEVAGFDAVVAKPIELEKLLRAMGLGLAAPAANSP
jgi:signal transduction histidine kinase/ActR/RegA family two-component response regulator